jgi:hypothetical protein
MSDDNTQDDYKVGYGKPPKNKRFQKGVSGNPKGRPKKCRNFYEVLIRESESLMPITENGQRKRLSKDEVAIKQLINQAMSGNPSAQRMYFSLRQQAHENGALVRGLQPNSAGEKDNVRDFTTEELKMIIAADLKKKNKKRKGHVSSMD